MALALLEAAKQVGSARVGGEGGCLLIRGGDGGGDLPGGEPGGFSGGEHGGGGNGGDSGGSLDAVGLNIRCDGSGGSGGGGVVPGGLTT